MDWSKSEIAFAFGVDERTVSRWQDRDDDPLPVAERRKTRQGNAYDPRAVIAWHRREVLREAGLATDGQAYDYTAERGRLTKAQADKTEIEVSVLKGETIRVPLVEQHWQGMVASMRAKLLALHPAKRQETQDALQVLVYEALEEIARGGVPDDAKERFEAAHDAATADSAEASKPKARSR